jgi:hypothetical protein
MAYSLFLFIRDVMNGNLVEWVDRSLAHANSGRGRARLQRMQRALVEPLRNVYGVSDKILNMTLADILLAAPPSKSLWLEIGSNMIAIQRTGLRVACGLYQAQT